MTAPFTSHSINCEDVILRRMFPGRDTGFFVDVGAEHPRLGNDFFSLYQLGWRGVNIEPNAAYFRLLVAERPGDQTLQLLLSDTAGQDVTFHVVEDTGLSTLDGAEAEAAAARGHTVHDRPMRTATLRDVLATLNPPHIDVLKVDVEGAEEQVLRGNDWSRFRPSLLLVEATYPQSPRRRPTGVRAMLEAQGYRHVHFDGLNDFYAEAGFTVPDGATLPPNVFDGFQRWDFAAAQADGTDLRRYVASLESERAALRDQVAGLTVALRGAEDRGTRLETLAAKAEPMWGFMENLVAGLAAGKHPDPALLAATPEGPDPVHAAGTDLERTLLAAHLRKSLAENGRLRETVKDLRHDSVRLAAAQALLQGEVVSLHRALGPARATEQELALLRLRLDDHLRRLPATAATPPPAPDPALAARLRDAQAMLDATRRSTSWRVTRPLRALRRLLG